MADWSDPNSRPMDDVRRTAIDMERLDLAQHGWIVVTDINPEPWRSPELSIGRRGGKLVAMASPTPKVVMYQEALREAILWPHPVTTDEPLDIEMYFWRRREGRAGRADATNLQKSTEDALHEVVFTNDAYNVRVSSSIVEQGPDVRPAVAIQVHRHGHHQHQVLDEMVRGMVHRAYLLTDARPKPTNESGVDPDIVF